MRRPNAGNLRYFADIFAWTGREANVRLSNPTVFARVHQGTDGSFLWLVNPTRVAQTTRMILADRFGTIVAGPCVWPQGAEVYPEGNITVGARDVVILRLT